MKWKIMLVLAGRDIRIIVEIILYMQNKVRYYILNFNLLHKLDQEGEFTYI